MPGLSIRNLPDELHTRLKERARRARRSLNAEVLCLLEEAVARDAAAGLPPEQAIQAARRVRGRMAGPGLSLEEIQAAIDEGRP